MNRRTREEVEVLAKFSMLKIRTDCPCCGGMGRSGEPQYEELFYCLPTKTVLCPCKLHLNIYQETKDRNFPRIEL